MNQGSIVNFAGGLPDIGPGAERCRWGNVVARARERSVLRLHAAGGTHVGLARRNNEDSFASLPGRGLFMVADGVGGNPGGEVASNIAMHGVRSALDEDDRRDPSPPDLLGTPDGDAARFVHAVHEANRCIQEAGRRDARLTRMATTFVGALVTPTGVHIAHVGDSRAYRWRAGRLAQLTHDHTVLGELRRNGAQHVDLLDELNPSLAGRLTRALGIQRGVEVETRVEHPEAGDVLLLCSDGLSGVVPEDELEDVLARGIDEPAAVLELIERALQHGGPDNVTCIVIRFAA